jgi:GNAT superfamily N-acetyltransferase
MRSEHLTQLSRVYVSALEHEADEQWSEETAHALLAHWLKRQPDLAYVAEYENRLVGAFVVGIRPWWDGNHLVDGELFVDRQYQGKGIARALMQKVLLIAVEKYDPVFWETYTFRSQDFPLDWYKRLGFREIEEWVMIRAETGQLLRRL